MISIGTVYSKKGQLGDFDWQIRSGLYENALFLFNDDEKRHHWKKAGAGNAVIRKYNTHALPTKPRSHGIVTGKDTGYASLTDDAKANIDKCFEEVKTIIEKHGYNTVYYSATSNGLLGTSIFQIGDDVREYITLRIKEL